MPIPRYVQPNVLVQEGEDLGFDFDEEFARKEYEAIREDCIKRDGPLPTVDELLDDPDKYAEEFLWIRPKSGPIRPLRLNAPQKKARRIKREALAKGKRPMFIYLKARREGVTTSEQAETFHKVANTPDTQAVTLAHTDRDSVKIFRMVELFYEMLPDWFRPSRPPSGNKRELSFPVLRSIFEIGTAGAKGFARGSTYNKIQWSEMAHSPGDIDEQRLLLAGITEAASEGEVVLESTGNGKGDLFEETWNEAESGQSDWTGIFLTWWDDPTNRIPLTPKARRQVADSYDNDEFALVTRHKLNPEQIAWRRAMRRRLKLYAEQEYPESPEQAFINTGICFFNQQIIGNLLLSLPAYDVEHVPGGYYVEWAEPKKGHEYVCGADTSEGVPGGDKNGFGIIDRKDGSQVAAAHGHFSIRQQAAILAAAHFRYNGALLGVERNNHGHAVIQKLEEILWETDPTLAGPHFQGGAIFHYAAGKDYSSARPGFETNPVTRPYILDNLSNSVETGTLIVQDRELLKECLGFKKNRTGKFEGKPDDAVMKWALAFEMLSYRSMKPDFSIAELGG